MLITGNFGRIRMRKGFNMKKISERIFYIFKLIVVFLANLAALFWPNSKSNTSHDQPSKTSSKKEIKKEEKVNPKLPKNEENFYPVNPTSHNHYQDYTKEKTLEEQLEEVFDECVAKLKLRKKDTDPIKEKVIKEIKEQIEKKEIKKDKVPKKMEEQIQKKLASKEKNLQSNPPIKEEKKKPDLQKEPHSFQEKSQFRQEIKPLEKEKSEKNILISSPQVKQETLPIPKTDEKELVKIDKKIEKEPVQELFTPIEEVAILSSISMMQPPAPKKSALTQEVMPFKEALEEKMLEKPSEEKTLPPVQKEIEVWTEKEEVKQEKVKTEEKNKEVPKEKKPLQEEEKPKVIDEDKEALESPVLKEEKENFQAFLQQKHLEEQLEFKEILNQLPQKTSSEVKTIEKNLMKERLKKASRIVEFPFLVGLPFIRNKFFLSFGLGVIVSKHLNFIQSLLSHQFKEYQPINLEEIKTGKEALEYAIFKNEENINQLLYLEQEILQKYPELVEDEEFIKQINRLKLNLYKKDKKLRKKEEKLGMLYLKGQKRVLKRKNWKGQVE